MITFKELYAENFRGYKKLHIPNLDRYGLTLIHGDNGSGKSSVRHLIEYLLVDSVSESIPLDELTYNMNGDCYMKGVLDVDGIEVIVEKFREHKKFQNKIILTVGGESEPHTYTDRRETQRHLESILGVNKDILSVSTIFSQHSSSFPEEKEANRKKIIYDVRDLHKYQAMADDAKDQIKELEKHLEDEISKEDTFIFLINDHEQQLKVAEEGIIEFEADRLKSLAVLTEDKLINIEEMDIIKGNMLIAKDKLKIIDEEKREKLEDIIATKKATITTLEGSVAQIKALTKEISKLDKDEILDKIKKAKDNIDNHAQEYLVMANESLEILLKDKASTVTKLKAIYVETDKVENSMCPVLDIECSTLKDRKDSIEGKYKHEIDSLEERLRSINFNISVYREDIEKLELAIKNNTQIVKDIAVLDSRIKYADKRTKELEELLDEPLDTKEEQLSILLVVLNEVEAEIETIKEDTASNNLLLKDLKNYHKTLELRSNRDYDGEIKQLEDKENPSKKLKDSYIQKLKIKFKELADASNNIKKLEKNIEYLDFWVKGYGKQGIPNMKSESFLDSIEYETNKILSSISEKMYVEIESQKTLKTQEVKEKIDYKVKHPEKSITSFYAYSGGQRQRVLLADKFAFNEVLGKFNFIMLDEVLEISLDERGKEVILSLLKKKSKIISPIFVVSHDDTIKDSFNNVIEVAQINGESKIV